MIRTEIEPNLLSFSNTTNITDTICTEVDVQIAPSSKTLSISKFRIGLKTVHALTLPHVQIYLDLFHRTPLQIGYQQVINEEEQTSKEIFFGLGNNCFEAKALLTRHLDNFTKFSIGVGHTSWNGLSWILCLQKADLCLNVPIQITSFAATSYSTVLYSLSSAYLGVLSGVIYMATGELLERTKSVVSSELKREEKLLSVKKARSDAENQQMLMKRKGSINRRAEESKGGLVIEKATYSVEAGDCLDVTIPLQFWSVDSSLKLPSSSFGSMLGFYDITNDAAKSSVSSSRDNGLISLWKSLFDETPKDEKTPVLYVRYQFNGKRFDLYTTDNEGLVLPNPRALEGAKKAKLANQKLEQMVNDQNEAVKRKEEAEKTSKDASRQSESIAARKERAQRDLDEAEPALRAAQAAVKDINKRDLDEVKNLLRPPPNVRATLECVAIMLGETNLEWTHVRKLLSKADFIPSILNFAVDSLTPRQVNRVTTDYLDGNDKLSFEAVMRSSKACGPLYKWAESQVKYSTVFNQVQPLRDEVAKLEKEAETAGKRKEVLEAEVHHLEESIGQYKADYATLIHDVKTELQIS